MSTIIALLVLTRVEATLVILSLLLVSAIIGFVSAWLYYRDKYRIDTQTLESTISQQKNLIATLKEEIKALNKSIGDKDNERNKLAKEKASLEEISATSHDTTNRKEDDLKMISGIGPFIEERLHAMDIRSYRQIINFSPKDIEKMNVGIEYFAGRIERDEWIAQAKELLQEEVHEEVLDRIRARKTQLYFDRIGIASLLDANDLTLISGIGGWIEKKLNALDIYTFKQIANFNNKDIELVTDAIEFFPGRIKRDEWVHQAKDLLRIEGKKELVLKRIKENKSKLSYTRLGLADKASANNLTLIKGISLWIEERLHLLDIYTFEQISKFSPEDVTNITEILDISPNRIVVDNWIGQAKELINTLSTSSDQPNSKQRKTIKSSSQ